MDCQACGQTNPPGARYCVKCGAALAAAPRLPGETPFESPSAPVVSGLAVAALVLGVLSLLSGGILSIVGLPISLLALIRINRHRDELTGDGFAIAGLVTSGMGCLLIFMTAAVLFPVFAQAREKARQASCQANVKQLALASMQYGQDWDEHFTSTRRWCETLQPYVRSEQVYACPSLASEPVGYAFNPAVSQRGIAAARAPHLTVLLFDATGGRNATGGPELFDPRHNDGGNLGYVDGHVKWVREPTRVSWRLDGQLTQDGER